MALSDQQLAAVVAVVVIGVGFFFRGLLQEAGKDTWTKGKARFTKSRSDAINSPPGAAPPQSAPTASATGVPLEAPQASISRSPTLASALPLNPPQPTPHLPSLSTEEVVKAVEAVPPLQRPGKAESYKGLRVRWPACFVTATVRDDTATLFLSHTPTLGLARIICKVPLSEYPQLNVVHSGHFMWVEGEIGKIGFEVTLDKASLDFHSPAPPGWN